MAILINIFRHQLLFVIQITTTRSKQGITASWCKFLSKSSILLHIDLHISTILSHQSNQRIRKYIPLFIINQSFQDMMYLRKLKTVNVIPATGISPVRREKTPIGRTRLERHTKIITLWIYRRFHILNMPTPRQAIRHSTKDIQTTHAGMSGGREIQGTIRCKRGKHFITGSINFRPQVIDITETITSHVDTP